MNKTEKLSQKNITPVSPLSDRVHKWPAASQDEVNIVSQAVHTLELWAKKNLPLS